MPALPYITDFEFKIDENPISPGQAKFTIHDVPWNGRILSNRAGPLIRGWIQDAGTGAGTYTQVQIRNVTKDRDYFTTQPRFRPEDKDGNGHGSLTNGVLGVFQAFNQGDDLALDCTGITIGMDSAEAIIWLTVEMYREAS